MRLLHICLYLSHFTFSQKSEMWLGFMTAPEKRKHHTPFPKLRLPSLNLETASYLTVLKGYWAAMVGFEYSPFCLWGSGSATIWHSLSALALPFQEEKTTPSESYCYLGSIVHTNTSQTEAHTCVPSHTTQRHFELFLPVTLLWF